MYTVVTLIQNRIGPFHIINATELSYQFIGPYHKESYLSTIGLIGLHGSNYHFCQYGVEY